MRRALILLPALVACGSASAHAMLERAEPRVGAVVGAAPTVLTLWFNEPVEPAFSSIEVQDAAGARVDRGKARVDPADPASMQISLKPLAPGHYQVRWRALSADTHTTQGAFEFDVRP